jgi:flavorubredoxin
MREMNNKKVAVIVHSQTGNTFSVAQKLRDKLLEKGINADLKRFFAEENEMEYIKNIRDKSLPDASDYDIIVFGAPVNAFTLSMLMKAYLAQQKSLTGKKVLCFVTMAFPRPWLGGNRAIAKMKKICGSKGAVVNDTGIVNWNNPKREEMISEITARFCDEICKEQ